MAVDTERTPLLREEHAGPGPNPDEVVLEGMEDPKNWPGARKWMAALMVSIYALMGPVSSSMVVPALPDIQRDLNMTSTSERQAVVSLFVLGWCLGPLYMAPCSEIFGRNRVLNLGHFCFLIVNTACGFCTDPKLFLVLRFLAGFVGSAPFALGGGTMSDLWVSEERGKGLAVYTVVPMSAPAVGAIFGGMLVDSVSWRWIFWGGSIFTALSILCGLCFMRETFAPMILKKKRRALEAQMARISGIEKDTTAETMKDLKVMLEKLVKHDLKRPFILLFTQPIIQALALYMMYIFGLQFLSISTFQSLFLNTYHQDPRTASFNYISIATGFIAGSQTGAPLNDKIYRLLKARNGGLGRPEYRTYIMVPAAIVMPIGLLLYGWSAEFKMHPIFPNIGIALYSFALIISYQSIQAYAMDCYPVYAASAIGALSVMRAVGGTAFPILGPIMYRDMGYGWAGTMLAGISLFAGGLSPFIFKWRGPYWREKSTYAAGDVKVIL